MIYRAIERSLAQKKCVCAASSKPDKRLKQRTHESYTQHYIQRLKCAGNMIVLNLQIRDARKSWGGNMTRKNVVTKL